MLAAPLLALGLGGVGRASVSVPGVTNFVELDGNERFDGGSGPSKTCEGGSKAGLACTTLGTTAECPAGNCTGGTNAHALCNTNADCASNVCTLATCVAFDWAKGPDSAGACSTSATGVVTCPGTNGLFDGGKFNGSNLNPSPPPYTGTDPTVPNTAHDFGADPLGIATDAAGVCANLSDLASSSAKPCASNADCTVAGETCKSCGTGDPSVYTGVGSEKNGDTISGETFATATVPNKDDISNVFALSHQDPNPTTFANTDTNEIFVGFERVINNGDSHVDLEFLQAKAKLAPGAKPSDFPCAGLFSGHRSNGDLLLSVDFTTGGTLGTNVLREWTCGDGIRFCVGGSNEGAACTLANEASVCTGDGRCIGCDPQVLKSGIPPHYQPTAGQFCVGGSTDGEACLTNADCKGSGVCTTFGKFCSGGTNSGNPCTSPANCPGGGACKSIVSQAINASGSISCGGWACRNADGTQALYCAGGTNLDKPCTSNANCPGSTCQSRILKNEFFESGIDLAAAGFQGCISTFLPHTRSSQSFTATLKDFAVLAFNTCRPAINVTKSCTAAVNATGTGVNVSISGQVCNAGTVTLSNIMLSNDAPNTTFNPTGCLAPGTTIVPGACCSYSGSYPETTTCSPTDQVTVTATGAFGSGTAAGTSNSATCNASCNPRLSVTKTCDATLNSAGTGVTVNFSGNVCACSAQSPSGTCSGTNSDVQLTNVLVSDDQGGITTPVSGNIGTLNPGACAAYSGSYTASGADPCHPSDTVTAMATAGITGGMVGPTMATANCSVSPTARISVSKCCYNHLVSDGAGHLLEQVDFKGQVCASKGGTNSDVQLTGITLSDDQGGVTNPPASTLARGACSAYSGTYFPTNPNTCAAMDTVTASGSGICSTTASDMATATCSLCNSTPCP